MITDINSEDRLVQRTFADHLEKVLGWENIYAYNTETFGPQGTLGRVLGTCEGPLLKRTVAAIHTGTRPTASGWMWKTHLRTHSILFALPLCVLCG